MVSTTKMTALLLLALAACATAFAADFPTEDGVLVLDEENFDDAIEAHDTLLVEFYAPWCGHCKKLTPEYAAAAAVLGAQDPPLFVAKVDATANRELGERFGVQGFPTLKFFRGGKPTDYEGGRTEKDIVTWVNKKSGPAATTLETVEAAEAAIEANDVYVIGFFDAADSDEAKAFMRAAGSNDDVSFGITTSAEVAAKYEVSSPAVALFKQFDEGRNNFEGAFTSDEIVTFVAAHSMPLVIPFSQEMAPKIFGGSIKVHFLLFVDTETDAGAALVEEYATTAAAIQGRALAITVNMENERVMGYFGITAKDLPTAVLVNMEEGAQMKKYMYDADALTAEEMTAFAERYFAGELKPFLKSEEVPEANDEPVTVLVGKNFEEVALDESKDVFVEFYAPWCGHCKALAPKWDALAEKFADVDSVIIAKMDATANEVDHPAVNVRGFPTLKFFPANGGEVQDYSDARETDAMYKFVLENAKSTFDAPEDEGEL